MTYNQPDQNQWRALVFFIAIFNFAILANILINKNSKYGRNESDNQFIFYKLYCYDNWNIYFVIPTGAALAMSFQIMLEYVICNETKWCPILSFLTINILISIGTMIALLTNSNQFENSFWNNANTTSYDDYNTVFLFSSALWTNMSESLFWSRFLLHCGSLSGYSVFEFVSVPGIPYKILKTG